MLDKRSIPFSVACIREECRPAVSFIQQLFYYMYLVELALLVLSMDGNISG